MSQRNTLALMRSLKIQVAQHFLIAQLCKLLVFRDVEEHYRSLKSDRAGHFLCHFLDCLNRHRCGRKWPNRNGQEMSAESPNSLTEFGVRNQSIGNRLGKEGARTGTLKV